MEFQEKVEFLNQMGTKTLIEKLDSWQDMLFIALGEDAKYRAENVVYLAGYTDDCRAVKEVLAKLSMDPPLGQDGKKATVAQVEAWLIFQRTHNEELMTAIAKQNEVAFKVENNRISIEDYKRRIDALKAVIALRTAQIEFLKDS